MKFNDSQKKWAMTGVLLATLGFNISPPKSMKSFTLLDMASSEEVKVDKITNDRGVFKVVYRASGKDKTIAEVSQVYTEAGAAPACDDCMSAIVLNKPIASKIDELNLFTAKAMANLGGAAEKAEIAKEEREEKPVREERGKASRKTEVAKKSKESKPNGVALLKEDIESLCSDMTAKETVSCVSDLAQDMFKNYEKYSINKVAMVTLLNEKMLRPLSSEISDIRRENSLDYTQSINDDKYLAKQLEMAVETSLTPLSDLIVEVVDKDASLARDLATKYTTLLDASKKAKSNAEASGKYQEARLRWEDSTLANYKISKVVAEGMQQGNEFSSSLQRQLDAYLQSSMQAAQTTGQSTVVDAQGNTWVRTDMAGRGYTQVGTPTSMGNSVVPQGIPTGGSFPQPIVPTAPAGTGTMQQVQPVPQTFVQPQVQQYQPQQYQQQFAQPQMYQQQGFVNPRVQQQYGTTMNQPGVINMNTVSNGTNQPGVINMGASNGTGRVGY